MTIALRRFWRDERATTAIEYTMIAALIALVIIVGVRAIGTKVAAKYAPISNALT